MKVSPRFHEKEVFEIVLPALISWAEVALQFEALDFTLIDDFAKKKRSDPNVEVWQSSTVVTMEFLQAGTEIYADEDTFDSLVCSVLPCSLPQHCVEEAVALVFKLATILGGCVRRDGEVIDFERASRLVEIWNNDILEETGDSMGSESAQIILAMQYQN